MQAFNILYSTQNYQPIRVARRNADGDTILRAQIRAGNIKYVERFVRTLLIVPLIVFLSFASARSFGTLFSLFWHLRQARISWPCHGAG